MKISKKTKWYDSGLSFECSECGACCAGPDEGNVWVNREEIEAIAKRLKISVLDFKKKYTHRVGIRYSLTEQNRSKDCVFLVSNGDGSKVCQVYSVRPMQCRTWPFWKENLRSLNLWSCVGQKCPGIDKGKWHSKEAIESIRDGNLAAAGNAIAVDRAAILWIKQNLDNKSCIAAIAELYQMLDEHIAAAGGSCDNCGSCCDFEKYGHRLYTTTLEVLYFVQGLHDQKNGKITLKNGRAGCCPYQNKSGCTVREYRPTGCRIYFCRDLPNEFQSEVTERILKRLRALHSDFGAVYYYADWLHWLSILK